VSYAKRFPLRTESLNLFPNLFNRHSSPSYKLHLSFLLLASFMRALRGDLCLFLPLLMGRRYVLKISPWQAASVWTATPSNSDLGTVATIVVLCITSDQSEATSCFHMLRAPRRGQPPPQRGVPILASWSSCRAGRRARIDFAASGSRRSGAGEPAPAIIAVVAGARRRVLVYFRRVRPSACGAAALFRE